MFPWVGEWCDHHGCGPVRASTDDLPRRTSPRPEPGPRRLDPVRLHPRRRRPPHLDVPHLRGHHRLTAPCRPDAAGSAVVLKTGERPGALGAGALTGQRTTPVRHLVAGRETAVVVLCSVVLGRARSPRTCGPCAPAVHPPTPGHWPTRGMRRHPQGPRRAAADVTVTVRSGSCWSVQKVWCSTVGEWPAILRVSWRRVRKVRPGARTFCVVARPLRLSTAPGAR